MFYNCFSMNATKIHIYIRALTFPQTIIFFLKSTHFALPPSYPVSRGFFPVWFLAFIKQANYANVSDDANDYVKALKPHRKKPVLEGFAQATGAPSSFSLYK